MGLTVESAALGTKASEGKRRLVLRTPDAHIAQELRASADYYLAVDYIRHRYGGRHGVRASEIKTQVRRAYILCGDEGGFLFES